MDVRLPTNDTFASNLAEARKKRDEKKVADAAEAKAAKERFDALMADTKALMIEHKVLAFCLSLKGSNGWLSARLVATRPSGEHYVKLLAHPDAMTRPSAPDVVKGEYQWKQLREVLQGTRSMFNVEDGDPPPYVEHPHLPYVR